MDSKIEAQGIEQLAHTSSVTAVAQNTDFLKIEEQRMSDGEEGF